MQYVKPNGERTSGKEGILADYGDVFDLALKDSEILALTNKMVADSEAYWNSINLPEIRKKNLDYWKGNQVDKDRLYAHQVPYVNNRIFPSIDTILSTVNAQMPHPEVFPDQKTQTSTLLAKDIEKGLLAYCENNRVDITFQYATFHLLTERIGWIKLRFDEGIGKHGEIVTEYVLPEDIIVDKDAKPGTNPRFIAQNLTDSLDDLIDKFPEKAEDIKKHFGIIRGTKGQLGKMVGYKEIWFTYRDKGKAQEGVFWKVDNLILGKMRNPNWNYKGSNEFKHNFLQAPLKPFINLNYLNSGRTFIDDTSAVEQAIPMQDVLNKRGRQIVENADQANSGWVISSEAMTADNAAQLIGDPNEKVLVSAADVRTAVNRMGAPALPAYVIEDKLDARQEVDNVFATHNVTRGAESGNKTLGQDQIQVSQDINRQNRITKAIEDAADRYYKYLLQMMKVFYTDDHWFMINGSNGQFDNVVLRNDIIKDGNDVRVKSGSSLPLDKEAEKNLYMTLANKGLIDPLTLMEELGVQDPEDKLERLVMWSLDPASLISKIDRDKWDRDAFMDIQILNRDVVAPPTEEVTEEHLAYHNEYLKSGAYRNQKNSVKEKHVNHITLEAEELRRTLLLEETQMPTNEEVEASNAKIQEMNQQDISQAPAQPGQPAQPGEQNPLQEDKEIV
jgi:hypothetical protein